MSDHYHAGEKRPCLAQRDALKAEVDRLSGKTGCCMSCEGYAKELERVRAERDKAQMREAEISSAYMDPKSYINELESKLEIAREALEKNRLTDYRNGFMDCRRMMRSILMREMDEITPVIETLYPGQCSHQVEHGHCGECG